MDLVLPDPALVLLVGPAGSGKSTFARKHFLPTEVVSSDRCRALVSDDENEQAATGPAFEILHLIVRKRLQWRRLTVVDATNVEAAARRPLLDRGRHHGLPVVAIVFDLPEALLVERNRAREHRDVGSRVVRLQRERLERTRARLPDEGYRAVHTLRSAEEVEEVRVVRRPFERPARAAPEGSETADSGGSGADSGAGPEPSSGGSASGSRDGSGLAT